MSTRQKRCIIGCDAAITRDVPIHRFPKPEKRPELFMAWISAVGEKLKESDPKRIYKNKRICDYHFDHTCKTSGGRLIWSAIPTLHLDRGVEPSLASFVEADHNYCRPRREPMFDLTNLPQSSVDRPGAPLPIELENLPGPSTATGTCVSLSSAQRLARKAHIKFDADKTFEYLEMKAEKTCARKIKRMKNELYRVRQKTKYWKSRAKIQEKISCQKNFEKLSENLTGSAKLFTRMQCVEGQKKKKGRRFTLEEKILSLSIFKKSPKGYKLMRKHFTLPSPRVLKSLLTQIKLSAGINEVIFKELKITTSKLKPNERLCTLIFDEMSISPQLHYNVYTDDLVGFENYGDEKTNKFANHVLVFMVKGIRKSFKQPVAYYFTQTLPQSKLKQILIEVISNVQATGLNIVATVCDQSSANVSTINNLISDAKSTYLQSGREWKRDIIIINDKEIIPLFDVPHLLKGIRNNMLNKELCYEHEGKIKSIKWEYFHLIFEADRSHGELRMLPKLTNEHIDPTKIKKMRVKNAAQVFSYSMAVAIDNLVARKDIPAECLDLIPFVLLIDKLFDSLNASSFSAPDGKIYRGAVKLNTPHHDLWQEALKMLKSIKFMVINRDGEKIEKSVPTIKNFIRTIEGFKSVWQLLSKKYSFDAVLTRNFNQDPLENFFGNIRSLGARNIAPNCVAFEGAFKTLLLNNYSSNHAINANCEEDSNDCLQSLCFLIKTDSKNATPFQSQNIVIDQPLNVMQRAGGVLDSGTDQRTYVCGWALRKCLQKVVKGCKKCKSKLLGDSSNELYKYIKAKEYCINKQWLCYPSECLVACFQEIQELTIAFLNNDCHKKNIKERIRCFIELFTDFTFLDCEKHKESVKQCFIDNCINVIIFSWCRSVNRILEGKMTYDGDDVTKKAAQIYHKKYKSKIY